MVSDCQALTTNSTNRSDAPAPRGGSKAADRAAEKGTLPVDPGDAMRELATNLVAALGP